MSLFRFVSFCCIWALSVLAVYSKTVRDTVETTDRDRIIVSYELTRSDNTYHIRFSNEVRKILGTINGKEYKDLSKIAVMFFDRTGNYDSDVSISKMVPESFMIPANVSYDNSSEGYFVIQDSPSLSFKVSGETTINIPLYLAYHPKKGRYELFSKSKGLKINLSPTQQRTTQGETERIDISHTDIEADNTSLIKALESVKLAKSYIEEADKLPFTESLASEISYLRQIKRELTDRNVLDEIEATLDEYEVKKRFLEEKAAAEDKAAQLKAEIIAKKEADSLQARNDSIAAVQQQQTDKAQKRNMWLIIGGIAIGVLGFIGNQVLQQFRTARNQRNMMNMQQSIADKAEMEAKRRARSAARNAGNRIASDVKQKTTKAVNNKIHIVNRGKNKNISI